MATLEQFKQVRASVSPEVQTELYGLLVQDLDAAVQKMIAIGAESNVDFSVNEVKSYLSQLDEEDEFVELDDAILAAVSGGSDQPSFWRTEKQREAVSEGFRKQREAGLGPFQRFRGAGGS